MGGNRRGERGGMEVQGHRRIEGRGHRVGGIGGKGEG